MSLSGKRVLVVGSDGFIGRNMGRWLDRHGLAWDGVGRGAGDLSQAGVADAAFAAAAPADVIFHLVTRQRTGAVQYDIQGELLRINSLIHLNVLEAWRTRQPQAKLVSAGSSCTYPESERPTPEGLFGAQGAHPSVVGYAQAKLTLATGSRCYGDQYGLKWLHAVLATVYGPGDHPEADRSHFMGALIHRAAREKSAGADRFTVWGSPEVVRELLYVEDQIEALVAASGAFENRILNCAADQPVTIGAAAAAVMEALDWRVPLEHPQGSFASAPFKMIDSGDFLAGVDWRPRWTLADGARATLHADGLAPA